jgi:Protein of unknown function (DUF1549)/Protein of unknown function (DUF1553)
MKRIVMSAGLLAVTTTLVFAAPAEKKRRRPDAPAPAKSAPAAPSLVKPEVTDSPWHVWSDAQGRKLEAAFRALAGNICTVQTREGATHRLNLDLLVPADKAFAYARAREAADSRFKDAFVKQAAFQIDHLIGTTLVSKGLKFNPPAADEQFLRRVYLDAVGRIPTADEAAAFLRDTSPDKRTKLVDTLLHSPGYTMHMYNWLADTLRVKDEFGKGAYAFLFQDWLKDQLAADRPWDAVVRDMLTADGKLCENGAAGFLLRDAQMPLDGVSNMLTTFLGANVACAQCHDHPLASWTQRDFYQMAAFFGASDGYDQGAYKQARRIANAKASGTGLDKQQVLRIAGANAFRMVDSGKQSLTLPKDYQYDDAKPGSPVAPSLIVWTTSDKKLPAYAVDTRDPRRLRDEFAKWMTHPDNPRFAANIANRIWKKVFGLAVQEPVGDLDDPRDASNPQLLAHLSTIMKAAKFDLREFQRVLFNSQTYQRAASITPDLEKGPYLFPGPLLRRMSAEQAWDSILILAAGRSVDDALLRRGEDLPLLALPGGAMTPNSFKIVADRLKEAGGIAMGGYGKKKTGPDPRRFMAAYDGAKPQQRSGLILARASELPQPAPESHFLRLFGQSDRLVADSGTTDGSVPQSLMLMNGSISKIVADTNAAALAAAGTEESGDGQIESLYLSFLARKPAPEEIAAGKKALSANLTLPDLAWTLLNAREFLFVQ